ncbi:MJ0570-related uncharacterized domain-containing protein [Chryseolinea serpens]|uniref:MJ0570-related uncharacterized domain-containing protein n=1 Tax=Chryseolinea serpens TaxID=947013 RepID=A0A1M5NHJ9_9BACT|nr:diphthine--ammonia ligase [Chryseolinea serpens]SHG89044.1 MJ0570-related uncharacterized domain-containing protein [Chryseolinea serpens]
MDSKRKVTISWSGGKDSAFALYKILTSGEYHVVDLHTTLNEETRRVGLHGVHEVLIEQQAAGLGLPLTKLYLPPSEDHDAYEKLMITYYKQCARRGVEQVVFGDIFLEDLRLFRENLLQNTPLSSVYPLWKIDTQKLLNDFIAIGFKTVICSADADKFSQDQVGHTIDTAFAESLRPGVDPCGENGEYHTLVYDGPIFKKPLPFKTGEVVKKQYSFQKKNAQGESERVEKSFWFQDLLPRIA